MRCRPSCPTRAAGSRLARTASTSGPASTCAACVISLCGRTRHLSRPGSSCATGAPTTGMSPAARRVSPARASCFASGVGQQCGEMGPRVGGQVRRVGDKLRYVLRNRIADRHGLTEPGSLTVGWIAGRRDLREQARSRCTFRLVALVTVRDRCHRVVQSYGMRRDRLHCAGTCPAEFVDAAHGAGSQGPARESCPVCAGGACGSAWRPAAARRGPSAGIMFLPPVRVRGRLVLVVAGRRRRRARSGGRGSGSPRSPARRRPVGGSRAGRGSVRRRSRRVRRSGIGRVQLSGRPAVPSRRPGRAVLAARLAGR